MGFTIGDTGCTTGGSKRIYDALTTAAGSGIVSPLVADSGPDLALKALAYSVSKGIGDELMADGGPSTGSFAINGALNFDDCGSELLKDASATSTPGLVSFALQLEAASLIPAGSLVGTLPDGFRPRPPVGFGWTAAGLVVSGYKDPTTAPIRIGIISAGSVYLLDDLPALTYYAFHAVFRANS